MYYFCAWSNHFESHRSPMCIAIQWLIVAFLTNSEALWKREKYTVWNVQYVPFCKGIFHTTQMMHSSLLALNSFCVLWHFISWGEADIYVNVLLLSQLSQILTTWHHKHSQTLFSLCPFIANKKSFPFFSALKMFLQFPPHNKKVSAKLSLLPSCTYV